MQNVMQTAVYLVSDETDVISLQGAKGDGVVNSDLRFCVFGKDRNGLEEQ